MYVWSTTARRGARGHLRSHSDLVQHAPRSVALPLMQQGFCSLRGYHCVSFVINGMFSLQCFTGLVLSSQITIITPSVNNTLHLIRFHLHSSKSSANMTSSSLPRTLPGAPEQGAPALLPLPAIHCQPDSQKPKY